MGLFKRKASKESQPNKSGEVPKSDDEIQCSSCGNLFPKSNMRKCKKCGAVLCPSCRKTHSCNQDNAHALAYADSTRSSDFKILKTSKPNSIIKAEFKGSKKLVNIIIPDTVEFIEAKAFAVCKNLKYVCIPDSVMKIDDSAFSGCDNLTISCSKKSYAYEYVKVKKINYAQPDLEINGRGFFSDKLSENILGNGWKWNSVAQILILNNFKGYEIASLKSLSIFLAPNSKNIIASSKDENQNYAVSSASGSINIDGDGILEIMSSNIGVYSPEKVNIISGNVLIYGKKYAVEGPIVSEKHPILAGDSIQTMNPISQNSHQRYMSVESSNVQNDNPLSEELKTSKKQEEAASEAKIIHDELKFNEIIPESEPDNIPIKNPVCDIEPTHNQDFESMYKSEQKLKIETIPQSSIRYCIKCGAKIENEEAIFCHMCGTRIVR